MVLFEKSLSLIVAILLFSILSCKKETLPPTDLKKEYYPLKLHSSITYKVDSTAYNEFDHSETNYLFELKDTVVAEIANSDNRKTFRIYRYKRELSNEWIFQKVIVRSLVDFRYEETLDNQKFVRIVFPPERNKKWNGNTYNNLGEQQYQIVNLDETLTVNGINFDSTLLVKQLEDINLIKEERTFETYAKGIGLIKKEVTALSKDINSGAVRNGFKYNMSIKSFQ